ncbi:hypothetical protein niasHT_007360 [Heterodera trifolii]|uniref:39S ribosomal protein L35, mitochondrial n=1 Tax=Heterodera trifolii TaxID=157864 RepID=A0ABD2LLE5_9BILA
MQGFAKRANTSGLLIPLFGAVQTISTRGVLRIPHWENHIRFDPRFGRKRPCQDVLDRFARLNNGLWVRSRQGRNKQVYQKDETFRKVNMQWDTCTKRECAMLDKLMTPFWLRPKHYVGDPMEPYHARYGITSPRVDDQKRLVRERPKLLLDDLTSDRFFDRISPAQSKSELLLQGQSSILPKLLQKAMPKKLLTEN